MPTQLIGIINLTPDSFSDGTPGQQVDQVIHRALTMISDGAAVIDIGAESTRPAATPLSADAEWHRLQPFLAPLVQVIHQHHAQVSLDTRHAATAAKALACGVDWINDVSGFSDPMMIEALRQHQANLVFMHSLDIPANPRNYLPETTNIIPFLITWAHTQLEYFGRAGIEEKRCIFDPGIGFGKNASQCWDIINHAEALRTIGIPILIGHSRKSFLVQSMDCPPPPAQRDKLTYDVTHMLAAKHINYLRVHDIKGNLRAISGS